MTNRNCLQLYLLVQLGILTLTGISLVASTTCIHEEDQKANDCDKVDKHYPCGVVIYRMHDVPVALRCKDSNCFRVISSKNLHDSTKKCFDTITVANFSGCTDCFTENQMKQPLEGLKMGRESDGNENTILDLSSTSIQTMHLMEHELLYGPIDNIDILYLSNNRIDTLPIEALKPNLRELWIDSNELNDIQLPNTTTEMTQMQYLNLRDNPMAKLSWKSFEGWPKIFPNLQVLDIGKNNIEQFLLNRISDDNFWFFYPILVQLGKMKKIYWPTHEIDCKCAMIGALARHLDSDFKISTAKLKENPHMDAESKDYGFNVEEFLSGSKLERYFSYYQEEKTVVCSRNSEWGLDGEKMEHFKQLSKKHCADILLEVEEK